MDRIIGNPQNEVSGCQYLCYATIAINVNWLALETLVFMCLSLIFIFPLTKKWNSINQGK
jgi:hypothetical protein